ncbi:MAG: hypothetical protein GY723_09105 [bacterium]|nr:hypothetical protein [bacterium]MCP5066022.1 hypothetical protein [bacterium]
MPYRGLILLSALTLASAMANARENPLADFPGMQLHARLEAYMESRKEPLAEAPTHYGLLFEIEQPDLEAFMKQIHSHQDGDGIVLGVVHGAEMHGGGLLAFLLDYWKPSSRAARLEDRFWFEASRRRVRLRAIYQGYKRQIFLPVPEVKAAEIDGRIPTSAQLPRMRFRYWTSKQFVETDAYKFLQLLIAHERDPDSTWLNHSSQKLSMDRLLRNARVYYLENRNTDAELSDHSHLHLVELLLAFDRRAGPEQDPNEIKQRFLEVELARRRFEGDDGSEALGHYAESLGLLLDDAHVTWQPEEKKQVKDWLRKLERDHFHDLDAVPLQHLSHLLKGLRGIRENRTRLDDHAGQPDERPAAGRR